VVTNLLLVYKMLGCFSKRIVETRLP
jgi:hypothetical protein